MLNPLPKSKEGDWPIAARELEPWKSKAWVKHHQIVAHKGGSLGRHEWCQAGEGERDLARAQD